jgi:hypothetical protein
LHKKLRPVGRLRNLEIIGRPMLEDVLLGIILQISIRWARARVFIPVPIWS